MVKILISNQNKMNILILLILCLSFTCPIPQKTGKNLLSRLLSQNEEPSTKTTKICEKTSSKFTEYYKIGDRNILNMDENNIEKYDSYYIKALINIVRHLYDEKKSKQNGNTRNLDSDEDSSDYKKNVLKYAYHILPLLIILGIGFLSLIAWIIWGICVCQKCKCCI